MHVNGYMIQGLGTSLVGYLISDTSHTTSRSVSSNGILVIICQSISDT